MIARLLLLPYIDLISAKTQRAIIDSLPWKQMHTIRDMVDLLHHSSLDIFEATKRSANEGDGFDRKDIMSVLRTLLMLVAKPPCLRLILDLVPTHS